VSPEHDAFDAGITWGLLGERAKAESSFKRHDALVAGYLTSWETEDWFRDDEEHYRKEVEEDWAESHRSASSSTIQRSSEGRCSIESIHTERHLSFQNTTWSLIFFVSAVARETPVTRAWLADHDAGAPLSYISPSRIHASFVTSSATSHEKD
jgi:hypothetical protein